MLEPPAKWFQGQTKWHAPTALRKAEHSQGGRERRGHLYHPEII
jgi:hypothetical protein